jgi:Fe-S cluster biosynthesis and repair protein YggX
MEQPAKVAPFAGGSGATVRKSAAGGFFALTDYNFKTDWRAIVARTVQCVMLKREAPGLERPPYPGELGRRIYESVSRDAWARWLQHQTMLINEYRLTPIEPKARKFLEAEMEKFFFGSGSSKPEGYKAPGSEE